MCSESVYMHSIPSPIKVLNLIEKSPNKVFTQAAARGISPFTSQSAYSELAIHIYRTWYRSQVHIFGSFLATTVVPSKETFFQFCVVLHCFFGSRHFLNENHLFPKCHADTDNRLTSAHLRLNSSINMFCPNQILIR